MAHWLQEPVQSSPIARQQPPRAPRLARKVTLQIQPAGRGPQYSQYDRNPWYRRELDKLTPLSIKTPKAITDAIEHLESLEQEVWPGLPEGLPELPTLEAESRAQWNAENLAECRRAHRAIIQAFITTGETMFNNLAKLPLTDETLIPILRAAHNLRSRTYGKLVYLHQGAKWKPVRVGDPTWVIGDLAGWASEGFPRLTAETANQLAGGLYTPQQVAAHVEALPTRTTVENLQP